MPRVAWSVDIFERDHQLLGALEQAVEAPRVLLGKVEICSRTHPLDPQVIAHHRFEMSHALIEHQDGLETVGVEHGVGGPGNG